MTSWAVHFCKLFCLGPGPAWARPRPRKENKSKEAKKKKKEKEKEKKEKTKKKKEKEKEKKKKEKEKEGSCICPAAPPPPVPRIRAKSIVKLPIHRPGGRYVKTWSSPWSTSASRQAPPWAPFANSHAQDTTTTSSPSPRCHSPAPPLQAV